MGDVPAGPADGAGKDDLATLVARFFSVLDGAEYFDRRGGMVQVSRMELQSLLSFLPDLAPDTVPNCESLGLFHQWQDRPEGLQCRLCGHARPDTGGWAVYASNVDPFAAAGVVPSEVQIADPLPEDVPTAPAPTWIDPEEDCDAWD